MHSTKNCDLDLSVEGYKPLFRSIKLSAVGVMDINKTHSKLNCQQNLPYISDFSILRINGMAPFHNLFIERPS